MNARSSLAALVFAIAFALTAAGWSLAQDTSPKKLVILAGKPSHPPRMHEFNAGVQLLHKCLQDVPGLKTEIVLNGWPQSESVFDGAAAVVFYMDGGAKARSRAGRRAAAEPDRRLDETGRRHRLHALRRRGAQGPGGRAIPALDRRAL